MICSRMGCELELQAYCGKHTLPDMAFPMMLVRALRKDDGKVKHYFAWTLRADGGANEVDTAIDVLPEVELKGEELKAALAEAE